MLQLIKLTAVRWQQWLITCIEKLIVNAFLMSRCNTHEGIDSNQEVQGVEGRY